ncbi:MAG: NPCBM/NEW2 domain-containing protein [Deltaproteobacteria bacterium]
MTASICLAICLTFLAEPLSAQVKAVAQPAGTAVKGQPPPNAGRPAQPGQPGQPAPPPAVSVTNIEDKQFHGPQVELKEGKLAVKSDPPQTVALDELQRVTFQHQTKLAMEWLGQENRDLVQVGAAEGGNGIRDVHVRATGLAARGIKQVAIVCRPQFRVWRLDVSQSPHWKIAVERIGQASVADFYFEPPARDLFESDLEITLTFDDNSTAKATLKAAGHTSDQAKIEALAEGSAAKVARLATLQLEGGDVLKGKIVRGNAEQVTLETAWQSALEVPIVQVRGLLFDGGKPEVKTKYDQQLAKPGEDDFALVLSKDGGLAEVSGRLHSVSDTGLKIVYEGQERSIKLERVQALVLAAHPATRVWKGPYQVFRLASGDALSGAWVALEDKTFQVKPAWGRDIAFPREAVVEVTGRNTKMVNLSELTPISVEQVPYFDRVMPYVRDKAWNNRPLKIDGKTYTRGLAVHSRCVLTYDLEGEFATFRALLGFDEEVGDRGRVLCRVWVDDKEVFVKPDFRSGEKPLPVEVPVKGAKQLRLEVDFGEDEDVGDRVIWANARLYREALELKPPPANESAAPASK